VFNNQDKYNESLDVYRTLVMLYLVDAFICIWISFYTPFIIIITIIIIIVIIVRR